MPIAVQCPSCQRRLNAPDKLLGKRVKCPSCGKAFEVTQTPKPKTVDEEPLVEPEILDDEEPEAKPRRRRPRDDDEDEDEEERPSRRRRDKKKYRPVRQGAPHRGGLILMLGILSIPCACCVLLGLLVGGIAINMAKTDFAEMNAGRMDSSGGGLTKAGYICGIVGVVLSMINMFAGILLRATGVLKF